MIIKTETANLANNAGVKDLMIDGVLCEQAVLQTRLRNDYGFHILPDIDFIKGTKEKRVYVYKVKIHRSGYRVIVIEEGYDHSGFESYEYALEAGIVESLKIIRNETQN